MGGSPKIFGSSFRNHGEPIRKEPGGEMIVTGQSCSIRRKRRFEKGSWLVVRKR